jgi:hypothetical protein
VRRALLSALLLGGAILGTAGPLFADEPGSGISAEPSEVTAGETVLLAGNGMEPDDERVIVLQGDEITVSLGTATTDAAGALAQEFEIPGHLPSGTYQLQAIGDETLQVELRVTAAEGGTAEGPPAEAAITPRDRTPLELAVILVVAAAAAIVGALLVWRAERVGGWSAR